MFNYAGWEHAMAEHSQACLILTTGWGFILRPSQNWEKGSSGSWRDLIKITRLLGGRGRISTQTSSHLAFPLVSSFMSYHSSPRLCLAPVVYHAHLPPCSSLLPHCGTCYFIYWRFFFLPRKFQVVSGDLVNMSSRLPSLISHSKEMPCLFLHCICAIYIYCYNLLGCTPKYTGMLQGSS